MRALFCAAIVAVFAGAAGAAAGKAGKSASHARAAGAEPGKAAKPAPRAPPASGDRSAKPGKAAPATPSAATQPESPLASAAVPNLGGRWEMQTMGTDRELTIEQRGAKILAHRVMWPEFEGQKYKLEHLYRGTLGAAGISGDLLVREEGQKEYEILRSFGGTLSPGGEVAWDGIVLKRLDSPAPAGAAPTAAAAEPASSGSAVGAAPAAGSTPVPTTIEKTASRSPAPASASSAPPAASLAAASEPADTSQSLFSNIMGAPGSDGLFKVSASIAMPDAGADLTAAGDELYGEGDYAAALAKFEAASRLEGVGDSALLARMGRCQLALRRYAEAKQLLGRALRLDPQNGDLKRSYESAKRGAS